MQGALSVRTLVAVLLILCGDGLLIAFGSKVNIKRDASDLAGLWGGTKFVAYICVVAGIILTYNITKRVYNRYGFGPKGCLHVFGFPLCHGHCHLTVNGLAARGRRRRRPCEAR